MRIPTRPDTSTEADKLKMPLIQILPIRIVNSLERGHIRTVQDLLNTTQDHLRTLPNIGVSAVKQILEAVEELGFTSSGDDSP